MAKPPKVYTRLARPCVNFGAYSSLWIGKEHILQVAASGYNERYQRFYFEDIQAFIVGASNRRLGWNLFWGGLALIPGLYLLSLLLNGETPVVSAILFGIAIVFLVWNTALGPGCRVHLISKVQTVRLHALSRRRKAERVLERLRPLIEAAQAGLAPAPPASPAPESTPAETPPSS